MNQLDFVQRVAPWADAVTAASWLDAMNSDGFVVVDGVLNGAALSCQRDALRPWLDAGPNGRNVFEGTLSKRVYAMLAKDPAFAYLVEHPLVLAFVDHFLGTSALLSACLAIELEPGESVQPWHTDDGHIGVPRPHGMFGLSVFWALDDTTEENGATQLLPGSHTWETHRLAGFLTDDDFADKRTPDAGTDPGAHEAIAPLLLTAGSVALVRSDLIHRGGANRSSASRLIVTPQYCAGWARPLETMLLAVPAEKAAVLSERVRQLLGYSVHPPFMGYVDGRHPSRVLEAGNLAANATP